MKLVVFDCDGTLIDTQRLIVEAMIRAFSQLGMRPPSREAVLGIIGLSLPEAIRRLAPGCEAHVTQLADAYRSVYLEMRCRPEYSEPLFEGARETLEVLAAHDDVVLGMATGKSRRGLAALLEREGLASFFSTVQTADDAASKPHPAMLRQAMAETGARPQDTVMVGDAGFDMLMARNARVMGIGVSWGYGDEEELFHAGAIHVAHSFSELAELVAPRMARVAAG
jgi:phosphoglycolate phosphatase